MSAAKVVLRDVLRRERAALPSPYREDATARVNERLTQHPAVRAGLRVGGYAATPAELNIDNVLARIIATHGQVYLPRVVDDHIEFCACDALNTLQAGFAGIREPIGEAISVATLDVLLIPGVGFDKTGQRLGHGAGHYDRILAQLGSHCVTIGVAFGVQIVTQIPTEAHDRPVQMVLTEGAVYPAHGL
ncbi:MAG: 5-formyltetrahydrofolate cyclo-ligase [Nitriliruptoraceae bacterium]